MTRALLINKIAKAIARQEGFMAMKGLGWECNNPGNLRDVKLATGKWWLWPQHQHTSGGFPMFPTLSEGFAALEKDLGIKINKGWSLRKVISAWAPPIENDTETYLKNVATWTGIDTEAVLRGLYLPD